ncbi:TetR/AcrR family transcriptional regulator [Rhodococcus sp. 3Y1]
MKASGLTHGGFYKQFASKDALIDEATTHAFKELAQLHSAGLEEHAGQRDSARKALIDTYLSVAHRDNPADGCPAAALAADMAREPADSEARRVYTEGVGILPQLLPTTKLSVSSGSPPCSVHWFFRELPRVPRSPRKFSIPRASN